VADLNDTRLAGTGTAEDDSPFINRNRELSFLAEVAGDPAQPAGFVVFRSPPGFGKSRLTSEFMRLEALRGRVCVSADPLIRARIGAGDIYDGYFLQRCAEALSHVAQDLGEGVPGFDAFLGKRRWRSLTEKRVTHELRTLPGPATAYKLAVEYIERFFSIGRRTARAMLDSDDAEAVALCAAYVDFVFSAAPVTLIVRETQHIDHESLRALLAGHRNGPGNLLILEYTTETGSFDSDHQKAFQRGLIGNPNAHIYDLLRLERGHLEQLLKYLPMGEGALSGDFYARWNGNLRVIEELRYQVSFGRRIEGPDDLGNRLADLHGQITEHLGRLDSLEKLCLALLIAHREPLSAAVLKAAVETVDPHVTEDALRHALEGLTVAHNYLAFDSGRLSIRHEDLVEAFVEGAGGKSAITLAREALRHIYGRWIRTQSFAAVSLATAARQAFRLSAEAGDLVEVAKLSKAIESHLRVANDQTIYVDIMVEIAGSEATLLASEQAGLLRWSADLAYEICDFHAAADLYARMDTPDRHDEMAYAHVLIELGRDPEALEIAGRLSAGTVWDMLAAKLIEGGVALDTGNWPKARSLFREVISEAPAEHRALAGHAQRLLCEVQPYPENTATALASVETFRALGLKQAEAYSALSASRFLARSGSPVEGARLIDRAVSLLDGQIRNEHLVLNNTAMVGLLMDAPDYERCAQWLRQALRTCRYDFGDLTILTNLAVAHWKCGDLDAAIDCIGRCNAILDAPEFLERDVFWPVCFNLSQVLLAAGKREAADQMRARAWKTGWGEQTDAAYWRYRYTGEGASERALSWMLRFDYHPVALSHWHIDLECVRPRSQ